MRVVRSVVDLVPVGPLILPVSVVIAHVISVADIIAHAMLPIAI